MTTYVVRRLLISIPVLFGIILAVFAITRILPGDACQVLLGERANQAACNAFNQAHGLDKPILEQFGTYVTGLFQGDLGTSFRTSRPVSALLVERIPMTLELSIYALTIATIGGLAARHHRGVQAELVRRRRGHGRRQRRRVDPDLRARPAAGLRVRQPPEGHAVRPAAVRAPHARCLDRPARRALGPRGPAGARCGPSWTSFRTCTR